MIHICDPTYQTYIIDIYRIYEIVLPLFYFIVYIEVKHGESSENKLIFYQLISHRIR